MQGARMRGGWAFFVASGIGLAACGGGSSSPEPVTANGARAAAGAPLPSAAPAKVQQIECGDSHTCALLDSGEVRCWGRNKAGQLGIESSADQVKPAAVVGVSGAQSIGLASTFSCAVLADKTVSCWGSGHIAGDGQKVEKRPPTKVTGLTEIEGMSVSGLVACARNASGKVTCWGLPPNHKGVSPGLTEPVAELAVAGAHGCALLKDGAVRCWADEAWLSNAAGFFAKPNVSSAKQLVVGDSFGCVLTKKDKVECWGRNEAGQLGTAPDFNAHAKPTEVRLAGTVTKLAAGEASACAVVDDGSAYCWGANDGGVLGLGASAGDVRPTKLPGVSNVTDICLASTHGCARTKAGEMYCWGSNAGGQLGDGTHERRATPVRVVF